MRSHLVGPTGLLTRRLLLVAGVYLAVRLAFLITHFELFRALPPQDILHAFVSGLRFDASAIVYSNALFILLSLAPAALLQRRSCQRALFALFIGVNGVLTLIMVGDVGYYPFTGARLTADVFALSGEAAAQADQLIVNFAGLVSFGMLLVAALIVFYPRQQGGSVMRQRWSRVAPATLFIVAIAVIGARGGLQKKPLKPIHAFAQGEREAAVLALNATFTLLHSLGEQQLEPVRFFAEDHLAEALLTTPLHPARSPSVTAGARPPRQNVMLLILESFSNEHWGNAERDAALTSFLDSLAQQGSFFTHNFANGQRSMDALPSMLLGVPRLIGQSLAVSGYQGNQWRGLGHFLGEAGYHTSMFHGAPEGTMYFDAIASMAGIREFYPLERYPAERRAEDFDGHWGLYDEPFLQFVADEVGTFDEPFFATVFTISTHQPYPVPPGHADPPERDESAFERSVRYTDFAVRRFFDAARTQPWFDNTLFILVGDHTPAARSPRYDTPVGRFMVPMLLYHPAGRTPAADPERITQHVDIFPTVLDYTGVEAGRVPLFGRSLFADVEGAAVIQANETFWVVTRDGVLERDPTGAEELFAYEREATGRTPVNMPAREAALSAWLSANVQHYTSSMIGNSFYRVRTPAM